VPPRASSSLSSAITSAPSGMSNVPDQRLPQSSKARKA
jgi:hypothetical protein